MAGQNSGPKPLSRRDWLFGSRPRRLLIEYTLSKTPPAGGWTKSALARACGTSVHGGVDGHVEGLHDLGLLVPSATGAWLPSSPPPRLATALVRVTRLLVPLPDVRSVPDPTRRSPTAPDLHRELRRVRDAVGRAEALPPDTQRAVMSALDEAERLLKHEG
jgi:hypothetical protein